MRTSNPVFSPQFSIMAHSTTATGTLSINGHFSLALPGNTAVDFLPKKLDCQRDETFFNNYAGATMNPRLKK